jgi:hypothetical protein
MHEVTDVARRKAEQRKRDAEMGRVRVEVAVPEGQQEAIKLLASELIDDTQQEAAPDESRALRRSIDQVIGSRRQVSPQSDLGRFPVANSTTPQFWVWCDEPNALDVLINQFTEYFRDQMGTWPGAIAWNRRPNVRMGNFGGRSAYYAYAAFNFAPNLNAE